LNDQLLRRAAWLAVFVGLDRQHRSRLLAGCYGKKEIRCVDLAACIQ